MNITDAKYQLRCSQRFKGTSRLSAAPGDKITSLIDYEQSTCL